MDDIRFRSNIFVPPVTTGTPAPSQKPATDSSGRGFSEILADQLKAQSGLNFSKHAVNRVSSRNIPVDDINLERLSEGVKLAADKGLGETLILIDQTAYIVNARNNTVITTVGGDDLRGNVFSNIEGTVII